MKWRLEVGISPAEVICMHATCIYHACNMQHTCMLFPCLWLAVTANARVVGTAE